MNCPLRVCVGAANSLPDDEGLAAFGDRFLVHLFVSPVADHQLEVMLLGGWSVENQPSMLSANLPYLDILSREMKQVNLDEARPALVNPIRMLRAAGVSLSDRRIVKSQRLVAAAVLAGRMTASEADIWPLLCVFLIREEQHNACEVLREQIASAANPTLLSAVEEGCSAADVTCCTPSGGWRSVPGSEWQASVQAAHVLYCPKNGRHQKKSNFRDIGAFGKHAFSCNGLIYHLR